MIGPTTWVTACIPTFECTQYLRRAVVSLLNQTYPFLRVIVINDGDPKAPWPVLADISDLRLVRYDLRENRGPYFALAIALEATSDDLFLIQDADDWSAPNRVSCLLHLLSREGTNYAFSTLAQFHHNSKGGFVPRHPMFSEEPDIVPTIEFKNRIPHHGLFQTEALKRLGGYFGGFRFGYDMLLMNMLLLTGSVSWTPDYLYWRCIRPTSLSHGPDTGWKSSKRKLIRAEMAGMYREAYHDYQNFVMRRISGQDLLRLLRSRIVARRGASDDQRIKEHATCLRDALRSQAQLAPPYGRRWAAGRVSFAK